MRILKDSCKILQDLNKIFTWDSYVHFSVLYLFVHYLLRYIIISLVLKNHSSIPLPLYLCSSLNIIFCQYPVASPIDQIHGFA